MDTDQSIAAGWKVQHDPNSGSFQQRRDSIWDGPMIQHEARITEVYPLQPRLASDILILANLESMISGPMPRVYLVREQCLLFV